MEDVNERTEKRYEPRWGEGGRPERKPGRGPGFSGRLVALAAAGAVLLALGLSGLAFGMFWFVGPKIAFLVLAFLVVRSALRFSRHRRWRIHGGAHERAMHAGCGGWRGGSFEDRTFV